MTAQKRWRAAMLVFALSLGANGAHAGVVISGTRVIYPAQEREVTIKLSNEGNAPALVQAWLDTGNPNAMPEESKVPFTLSPPLFRLDPKKGQSLRLIYTQEAMPQDRESLFWLNVLEVPPRAAASTTSGTPNSLQLAFRSRIKVFFRPAGLSGDANDAASKVTWKFVHKDTGSYVLEATNPTAYHVTFSKLVATDGTSTWQNDKGGMVDPDATMDFDIGSAAPPDSAPQRVDYTFINDYGAGTTGKYEARVKP